MIFSVQSGALSLQTRCSRATIFVAFLLALSWSGFVLSLLLDPADASIPRLAIYAASGAFLAALTILLVVTARRGKRSG